MARPTETGNWIDQSADAPAIDADAGWVGLEGVWHMFVRHRWRCILVAISVCLAGGIFLVVQEPTYTAHTTMVVVTRQPDLAPTDQVAPVVRTTSLRESDVESEVQLMLSNQALIKVAQDLDLQHDPEFQKASQMGRGKLSALHRQWNAMLDGDWNALPRGDWQTFLRSISSDSLSSSGIGANQTLPTKEEAIAAYLQIRLKAEPIDRSTTIEISFTAHDRNLAALVTNAVADTYIANRYALRRQDAERAAAYLRNRASELREELNKAEEIVENFRATSVLRDGRDIDQLRAVMEKTNSELTAARMAESVAVAKLETVEARVKQFGIVAAFEPGESRLDDQLRELAAEVRIKQAGNRAIQGGNHPDTLKVEREYGIAQSEVVSEAQARLSRLRSDIAAAAQQIQMLEASLQASRADFNRLSAAAIKLRGLERQAAASRAVYESFLGRVKLTEQVGFNEAQSWVISRATPPVTPTSPNVSLIVGATVILALGAALSAMLLSEHKKAQTVLSLQHVYDRGLKALGVVPDLGNGANDLRSALLAANHHEHFGFSESFGTVFTSLLELARQERSCLVLLITSSLPFEGKSTTATALAAKIACAGKRVLLIDADLRAPRLHSAFNISTKRGLTDVADPTRNISDSIYYDKTSDVSLLPAGPPVDNPQNILRSDRLHEAIQILRPYYDFILIDSPPVLPIADARILVPLTDYCLFVAHWRKTRWAIAMHALRLLRDAGARIAGVVVSKADVKQLATYGFPDSESYSRTYLHYSSSLRNSSSVRNASSPSNLSSLPNWSSLRKAHSLRKASSSWYAPSRSS